MDIAKRLRQITEANGLTAEGVIFAVGMSVTMYSGIENGKIESSLSALEKVKALGVRFLISLLLKTLLLI